MNKLGLLFLLLSTVSSFGQVSIDLSAGPNLTIISSDNLDYDSKIGFQAGGQIEYKINNHLGVISGLLFHNYSAKWNAKYYTDPNTYENVTLKNSFTYLDIPIGIRFYLNDKFSLMTALNYGIKLKAKISQDGQDIAAIYTEDGIKKSNTGLKFGAGLNLSKKIGVEIIYDFGLTDITDDKVWSTESKETINSLQLLVNYRIHAR